MTSTKIDLGGCSHHSGDIDVYNVPVGNGRWLVWAQYSSIEYGEDHRFICAVEREKPHLSISGKHNECIVLDCTAQPVTAKDLAGLPDDFRKNHSDFYIEEWDNDYAFNIPHKHGFISEYFGTQVIVYSDGSMYNKNWSTPFQEPN